MWKILKIDMIGLVETQINLVSLQSKSIVVDNLFQAESNFILSITTVMKLSDQDNKEEF